MQHIERTTETGAPVACGFAWSRGAITPAKPQAVHVRAVRTVRAFVVLACVMVMASSVVAQDEPDTPAGAPPAPPSNVTAEDHPLDKGDSIDVRWELSPDDGDLERLTGYRITRSRTDDEIEEARKDAIETAAKVAKAEVTEQWREELKKDASLSEKDPEQRDRIRQLRQEAAEDAKARAEQDMDEDELRWAFVTIVVPGTTEYTVDKLPGDVEYQFAVASVGRGGVRSERVVSQDAVAPALQWFDGGRFWLAIITLILGGSVVTFIWLARTGRPLKVRKIAGLEAVDEAVGRATEMGRSCLFIPGIQDMNDIQTIAGITILSRVAKTAAEYDAKIEVPTSRSLVMTTARETVQSAFLAAGRPDAYNEDLIYYVTDEQFGYVAYLSGMMVREKPAACFYMGSFFAESLILAETGNSIGAIQVAGTAQPAQLPFFVAACDYTLIGEEFFAASAYLSGSPEELGSLKGQDVGKVIVALGILVGVLFITLASIGLIIDSPSLVENFGAVAAFIRETILT